MRTASVGQWQVARANGEQVTIEAATEREARLVARESFPDDRSFEVQLLATVCERCRAAVPAGARCEACRQKREARKRSYLVRASFLLKSGWTAPYEGRVRAFSVGGATALGIREAKRASVRRGARIAQAKVDVIAVRK